MKNKSFILPDFKHSNLNISATLAEFLGVKSNNATLPILKKALKKEYKNVVFICFDGMGVYPLTQNLEATDYLIRNITDTLVSTFPSTTANATTSLTTDTLPLEHGWSGWSVYFEKLHRNVNVFLNTDSWTNEELDVKDRSPLSNFDYYFDKSDINCKYAINTVFPPFIKPKNPRRNTAFDNTEKFFDAIQQICNKDGKQFVYAYNPEPDHSMHELGVTNPTVAAMLRDISLRVKRLVDGTKDTLLIITADHGQIDIEGYVELYKDEYLYNMLEIYPYLEPRAIAFKVKESKKTEFENYFTNKYGQDFELHTSRELVERGFFGNVGNKAQLLGDYIAIGTYTHKIALFTPDSMRFKGHHTSLTEEMQVPLIIIKSK